MTFIFYMFGWSNLFPQLSLGVYLLLAFTAIVSVILGIVFYKKRMSDFYQVGSNKKHKYILLGIAIGYVIEFIEFKGIPLVNLFIGGNSGIYMEFGIPTFHVFLVTFNCFFAVYMFHVLLSSKQKKQQLLIFLCLLLPAILIVNRAMLLMTLASCAFVYLSKVRKISIKNIGILVVIALLVLYGFGIFGNMRVNDSYNRPQNPMDNTIIYKAGGATKSFQHSLIPKPYFWSYIYIASPLANLQKTVELANVHYSFDAFGRYVYHEWLPDFISKRIDGLLGRIEPTIGQISPELNVGTMYSKSYILYGWIGCILTFLWMSLVAYVYLLFLKRRKSPYYLTTLAVFNTIFLFSIFSNMFTFSGWTFQLVYPLIFILIEKWKSYREKKRVLT